MNRQTQTLGGIKKQEKSLKTKSKRKINKKRGDVGFPANGKNELNKLTNQAPISVFFLANTKGGILDKRLQEEAKRLGRMTSYRVRIAETAGMVLSRLLPSTNHWGSGDYGCPDCVICEQQDDKPLDCSKNECSL